MISADRYFFVLAALIAATAATGCRDNVAAQKAAVEAARKADPGPAPVADAGASAKAVEAAAENVDAPEKPKSRYHPAAMEQDYEYVAKVWETDEERGIIDYLTRASTAEKGYRIIRKKPKKYLPLLRKSIRAQHREVRIQTAVILGLLKDRSDETFKVLRDCLLLDSDPDVRAIAAKAFVVLKKKEAVDALIRSLNEDPYEAARANAAWALGSIRNRDALPHLRAATRDEDTFVRLRAVSALLKIKSRDSIPELIERLEDKSPMVQERAREALKAITGVDMGKDRAAWEKKFPQATKNSDAE